MATICDSYNPSDNDTQRFWGGQSNWAEARVDVPNGFPRKLDSSLAWKGDDILEKESEWKLSLSDEDIGAISAAVTSFDNKYEDLSAISSATFELPAELAQRLGQLSENIYKGYGFQIIHGLDPSRYSPRQNIILYAGLSAYVCPQRGFVDVTSQRVVGHVVNVQDGNAGPKTVAPAFSNTPLSFHTDNCEVLSFYYKEMPLQGGRTILSSSWQVYNQLAETHPKVLYTLAEPWVLDSFKSYSLQPPRNVRFVSNLGHGNNPPILFRFSRYPILGWQRKRNAQLPAPSQAQLEALDAVQFTAERNAMTLPVSKGDILFINDMAVFHAREGFDESGAITKRHVMKMYLRDPSQGWSLPQSLHEDYSPRYSQTSISLRKEIWDIHHENGLEELSFVNG